ncbi:MAG: MmcQ/YjbR family DNA-binding protein [Ornithinibacter sp.]
MAAEDADRVTRQDLEELALALPEVVAGTSWGDRPSFTVRDKAFVRWRGPRKDAVDPDTGDLMDDVIAIVVPTAEDKAALLQSGGPWFTTPHFDGYNHVLVRERDLHLLDRDELAEVLTDAWATRAPKPLVAEHLR